MYCEWYSTHVEMCSRPSDMNVMCFIIFQRHRNQRVQQPLWWRAALAIHTLLFRREADGRRDDRRWKCHPCPGLTTGSTGSYLTRVLREKTKKKKTSSPQDGDSFLNHVIFPTKMPCCFWDWNRNIFISVLKYFVQYAVLVCFRLHFHTRTFRVTSASLGRSLNAPPPFLKREVGGAFHSEISRDVNQLKSPKRPFLRMKLFAPRFHLVFTFFMSGWCLCLSSIVELMMDLCTAVIMGCLYSFHFTAFIWSLAI